MKDTYKAENKYLKQGYVTLHQLTLDLLASMQETTLYKYIYMLHYLIKGYQEMIYSTIPITKLESYDIPDSKMLPYPNDFIGLIEIYNRRGDRLEPLGEDDSIAREDRHDERYAPKRYGNPENFIRTDAVLGTVDDNLFIGHEHNRLGYYKNNAIKKRFEFSVDTAIETVYIQYVGYVFDPNTETAVPLVASELLMAYAFWKWALFRFGASNPETEARSRLLKNERSQYKANTSNLSRDSIISILKRQRTLQPRY